MAQKSKLHSIDSRRQQGSHRLRSNQAHYGFASSTVTLIQLWQSQTDELSFRQSGVARRQGGRRTNCRSVWHHVLLYSRLLPVDANGTIPENKTRESREGNLASETGHAEL